MDKNTHLEVFCSQRNHHEGRICGDVFLSKKIKEEDRIITVLSDGLGHGVKANMLASLTATLALSFTEEHKDPDKIAEIIMDTLPVCSERQISYATFTIVDIKKGKDVTILEYDNPICLVYRKTRLLDVNWNYIQLESEKNKGKIIRTCNFVPEKEDRIVFFSDGIAQSGLGSEKYPLGWGEENMELFLNKELKSNRNISAEDLSQRVVKRAIFNDGYLSKDDTSCGVIYFRKPRRLLIVSGPPFEEESDKQYGDIVRDFDGKKIACGATTTDIISRELGIEVTDSFEFIDPELPPISYMEGFEVVTEGILTLGKTAEMLNSYTETTSLKNGPADLIVKQLLESDYIHFLIGTKINIAHQDPSLPVELEIRRTVVKRIAAVLEEKFLKEVKIEYI